MKILLISDIHYSIESKIEDERWFPPQVARMSAEKAKDFLEGWDNRVQQGYSRVLREAVNHGPYDLIISLGDNTSGNNERGMIIPKAQDQWVVFRKKLEEAFSGVSVKFVYGGHDVGYLYCSRGLPAIGLQKTMGMTRESFETARQLLGEPWQHFKYEGTIFLLLNSEIIRTWRESTNQDIRHYAAELVAQQNEYIRNTFFLGNEVVLLIHDCNQLLYLQKEYDILDLSKIRMTITGHFHLPIFGSIYRLAKPFFRQINLRIVPSTFGLACLSMSWGKGGFCIYENGTIRYHCIK